MFYAPWCGHCKNAKPELTAAADHYKDNAKVEYAAVDCTVHSSVCSAYEVSGYPTFKYFQVCNYQVVYIFDDFRLFKLRPLDIFWSSHRSFLKCFASVDISNRSKTLQDHWTEQCEEQKISNGLSYIVLITFDSCRTVYNFQLFSIFSISTKRKKIIMAEGKRMISSTS